MGSTLRLEFLHPLFQIKFIPSGKISELSLFMNCLSPGVKYLSHYFGSSMGMVSCDLLRLASPDLEPHINYQEDNLGSNIFGLLHVRSLCSMSRCWVEEGSVELLAAFTEDIASLTQSWRE